MPISRTDPYYLSEFTPDSIEAVGDILCNHFNVGPTHFGSKGDDEHYSGYHRSENWIRNSPDSRYRDTDYSLATGPSQSRNAISAFDFTPHSWGTAENTARMIAITRRVYEAARKNDPRLAALHEFAGTLDGRTVITFYGSNGNTKNPFNSSHLHHIHASIRRNKHLGNLTGIAQVMIGDEMNPEEHGWLDETRRWAGTALRASTAIARGEDTWKEYKGGAPETAESNWVVQAIKTMMNQQSSILTRLATIESKIGSAAGGAPSLDEIHDVVEDVVDQELDEQSRAGADDDSEEN